MNYYSHHIGDYLTATAHLSILEDGCYRRMMDRYYTTELPLPSDEQVLFRLLRARSEEEKEAVRVVLDEFFTLTDSGWSHKRCEEEIAQYKEKSGKAAEAANKRWNKSSNADAMPTHSERNADAMLTNNQEPITNNQEPLKNIKPSAKAHSDGYTQEFEDAWAAYPDRPGASKKESFKAWNARIKAGTNPEDMLHGVVSYAAYVKGKKIEPEFIKQPSTFFGPAEHFKSDWTFTDLPNARASPHRESIAEKNERIMAAVMGNRVDDGMTIEMGQ